MVKTTQCLSAVLGLASFTSAQTRFGPYYSLGATKSYIVEAQTTLYPGKTPNPERNRLALWAGMGTSGDDLIQTIILSSKDAEAANCGGKAHVSGQWCVFASTLQDGRQVDGPTVPMDSSKGVTVNYKYDGSTGYTKQTVSIDGKVVSTLSTKSGLAEGWGTAVECQDECQGLINAHTYSNTTITLAAADTNFAKTLSTNQVDATSLTTTDNRVFHIDTINVRAYTFSAASS